MIKSKLELIKSKLELIIGAVAVGFLVLLYAVLDIKVDLKWCILGAVGYVIVRRSIKRIIRRKNDAKRT